MRSAGTPIYVAPDLLGLVVVEVDRDPQPLGVEAVTTVGHGAGEQLPGVADGAFLEVVAEGEVAAHLEERAVPGGLADLFDVRRAHALLHAGGARDGRLDLTEEVRLEGHHARGTSSRVGSSAMSDAEGTTVCPRSSKKLSQRRRISADSISGPHSGCTSVSWCWSAGVPTGGGAAGCGQFRDRRAVSCRAPRPVPPRAGPCRPVRRGQRP